MILFANILHGEKKATLPGDLVECIKNGIVKVIDKVHLELACPVLFVFVGKSSAAKAETKKVRRKSAHESYMKYKQTKKVKDLKSALYVNWAMVLYGIVCCLARNVEHSVAPYEADQQMYFPAFERWRLGTIKAHIFLQDMKRSRAFKDNHNTLQADENNPYYGMPLTKTPFECYQEKIKKHNRKEDVISLSLLTTSICAVQHALIFNVENTECIPLRPLVGDTFKALDEIICADYVTGLSRGLIDPQDQERRLTPLKTNSDNSSGLPVSYSLPYKRLTYNYNFPKELKEKDFDERAIEQRLNLSSLVKTLAK
eukprot:Awhi_evm1s947